MIDGDVQFVMIVSNNYRALEFFFELRIILVAKNGGPNIVDPETESECKTTGNVSLLETGHDSYGRHIFVFGLL